MAASAVYGLYQPELNGQDLKSGAAVATVAAHVAVNNLQKVAVQDHMLVELFA
jgi:hypothetical protein